MLTFHEAQEFEVRSIYYFYSIKSEYHTIIVRGDRDSRANLMPIYGDLYQIKL